MLQLIPTSQAAQMLGLKPQTLRVWRLEGKGPKYVRMGNQSHGRAYYDLSDIQEWISDRKYGSTSEETVKNN